MTSELLDAYIIRVEQICSRGGLRIQLTCVQLTG